MSGLLKADFYRLFRSKFFYILGGVVLLLSLAVFALLPSSSNSGERSGER